MGKIKNCDSCGRHCDRNYADNYKYCVECKRKYDTDNWIPIKNENKSLSELLSEVDRLFKTTQIGCPTFSYSLNRLQNGYWRFTITDDWHKYCKKHLTHQFGDCLFPENAVLSFLDYIKQNKINVKKMCD